MASAKKAKADPPSGSSNSSDVLEKLNASMQAQLAAMARGNRVHQQPDVAKLLDDAMRLRTSFSLCPWQEHRAAKENETEAMNAELMKSAPDWEVVKGCNERRKRDACNELTTYMADLLTKKPAAFRGYTDDVSKKAETAREYGLFDMFDSLCVFCKLIADSAPRTL